MANPFDHFFGFLLAVWGHAFTLLAGCAITVVIGWIERHIIKKKMPFWADLAIVLSFVFFACFQAWHDKYKEADRARLIADDLNKPKLSSLIEFDSLAIYSYPGSTDQSLLIVRVLTENKGAPSILRFKQCVVRLRGGREVVGKLVITPPNDFVVLGRKGVPDMTLERKDYLPVKGMASPIPRGGAVEGWNAFVLPGIPQSEMPLGSTTIVYESEDIDGVLITANIVTGSMGFNNLYVPDSMNKDRP